jgi:hypothetical protein
LKAKKHHGTSFARHLSIPHRMITRFPWNISLLLNISHKIREKRSWFIDTGLFCEVGRKEIVSLAQSREESRNTKKKIQQAKNQIGTKFTHKNFSVK